MFPNDVHIVIEAMHAAYQDQMLASGGSFITPHRAAAYAELTSGVTQHLFTMAYDRGFAAANGRLCFSTALTQGLRDLLPERVHTIGCYRLLEI